MSLQDDISAEQRTGGRAETPSVVRPGPSASAEHSAEHSAREFPAEKSTAREMRERGDEPVELEESWRTEELAGPPPVPAAAARPGDFGAGLPPVVPPPAGSSKDPEEGPEDGPESSMSLLEHLGELRIRLVRAFMAAGVGFLICYNFSRTLYNYLALPLVRVMPADTKLIYLGLPDAFFVDLKIAFVAGCFLASPYIFYQIWAFIAPGLYDEEKRHVIPLAACSALFFLAGAAFCYFGVFPFAFTFFLSYSTDNIVAMPSIDAYLSLTLKMLLAFGLIFEMPLFAFFLARMGLVTPARMRKARKYAVLVIFVVAALLTPPDIFSQMLMAVPMLLLYELSVFVAAAGGRNKKKSSAKDAPQADA